MVNNGEAPGNIQAQHVQYELSETVDIIIYPLIESDRSQHRQIASSRFDSISDRCYLSMRTPYLHARLAKVVSKFTRPL